MKTHLLLKHNKRFFKKGITKLLVPLFLILIADSILSYAFPIIVEEKIGSLTMLGIIMAMSSVAGVVMDFLIPKLFGNIDWKRFLVISIILSFAYPVTIALAHSYEPLLFFLLGSVIWGVYYEFLSFAQQSYIIEESSRDNYTRNWSLVYILSEITTIAGPIIGAALLAGSVIFLSTAVIAVQVFALLVLYLVILFLRSRTNTPVKKATSFTKQSLSIIKEFGLIRIIGSKVFPVFLLGFVSSAILYLNWTLGGLYGEALTGNSSTGWVLVVSFNVGILLSSAILAGFPIKKRKKRISQICVLLGGVLLIPLAFVNEIGVSMLIVFVSSAFVAFAVPLNDAVFSDLANRNPHTEMYVMSIVRVMVSLSYFFVPLIAGFLSESLTYGTVYAIFGIGACFIAIFTFAITPKKIRLPEKQIEEIFVK